MRNFSSLSQGRQETEWRGAMRSVASYREDCKINGGDSIVSMTFTDNEKPATATTD